MLEVWVRRWDMSSSLELNLRPQKSRPCIQEHMNCEAPPTVRGRLVGGGAGAELGGGASRLGGSSPGSPRPGTRPG